MLAANIWHWWIGVILTLVGVAVAVALVAAYLKSVSAQKYPPKASRQPSPEPDR